MPTSMVPVKSGYLASIQGYWIYEVDNRLIIPVRTHIGVHELFNCDTLADLVAKVEVTGDRERKIYGADDFPALFDELAFQSDKFAWDDRNPEVKISLNEEAMPEAEVWLDRVTSN